MTDADLVREAVKQSGLSSRVFSESITWRDERTIRRWVAGDAPVPETARKQLEWFLALTDHQRSSFVSAACTNPPIVNSVERERWVIVLAEVTRAISQHRAGDPDQLKFNRHQRFVGMPYLKGDGTWDIFTMEVPERLLQHYDNGAHPERMFARSFVREYFRKRITENAEPS